MTDKQSPNSERQKALALLAMKPNLLNRHHQRSKALASLAVAERDILAPFGRSDRASAATKLNASGEVGSADLL